MMKFRAHVLDTDHGYKSLKQLGLGRDRNSHVRVGLVGPRAEAPHTQGHDEASVVFLGLVHEFGTDHVPERSFLRSTLDAHQASYRALYQDLARLVLSGAMSISEALVILGESVAADLKRAIEQGLSPPLAAATLADPNRGEGPPLVVTHQLLEALGYQVVLANRPQAAVYL